MDKDLQTSIIDAIKEAVLKDVERRIRLLECDVSATADEHIIGYRAGYNEAKRLVLDILRSE